jgi:hypothetical protein
VSSAPSKAHQQVKDFFTILVFGFIATDIRREINLVRENKTGGNFLCALGLLCYTELLGGVKRGTLARGEGRANFDAFFADLGSAYNELLDAGENVYEVVRCGMAHEYLIKTPAMISMLKDHEPAGVYRSTQGHYFFCVERYYDDFMAAARRLEEALLADPSASLPPELAAHWS